MGSHEAVVRRLAAADPEFVKRQLENSLKVLNDLHLQAKDVGWKNVNELGEEMLNQCFYLSIASSAINDNPDTLEKTDTTRKSALVLKRSIEAIVLEEHPDWKNTRRIGENIQAFDWFLEP